MLKEVLVRLTVVAFVCCLSMSAHAMADQVSHVNVPAGDLTAGLELLARQSGAEFVYRADQMKGLHTRGVTGDLTPKEAVTRLLIGTPLQLRMDPSGAMLIAPARVNPTSDTSSSAGSDQTQEGKSSSSGSFLVAQATPGQASGDVPVEKQDEDKSKKKDVLQEVVVTGTHLHDSTNPTAPLIVIDRAEIERSGYTTVQELVDSIPQNFRGGPEGATEDGLVGAGGSRFQNDAYGTGINLRGLGASSTLVLVDGHRLSPSAEGLFADVSIIPLTAIERVEVMTDGASAIYGSDAVAGVVNFILRKDYKGLETWANYGSGTDGTRPQAIIGQAVGQNWSGGSAIASFQYQKEGALNADDRSYTASAPSGTDLLPKWHQYSGVFNIRQDIGSGLDMSSDVLYARKTVTGDYTLGLTKPTVETNDAVTNSAVATIDLGFRPTDTWRIDLTGAYSRDYTNSTFEYLPRVFFDCFSNSGAVTPCVTDDNFNTWSGDLVAAGTLLRAPGGDARAALGTSYRNEALDYAARNYTASYPTAFDRHVFAEFAELELPIVGPSNPQLLARQLALSLAIRHDDYSDFGATTNPRYGVSWKPVDDLHIRGAYSTSFRAPNAWEDSTISYKEIDQVTYASPSGGTVPVFQWYGGGGPPLKPEKSQDLTAGLDFEPRSIPTFKASVNYYNIKYRDRISTPSFTDAALLELNVYGSAITPILNDAAAQSLIQAWEAQGGIFGNYSGVPDYVGVRYLLRGYLQNLAEVRTNGVDLSVRYRFSIGGNDFHAGADATHINEILTSVSGGATPTDTANTYGNPLHWRARGQFGWNRGPWSINSAVNHSGSYVDTTTVPFGGVGSWTTVDAQVAYSLPFVKSSFVVSLSGINVFNQDPPFVTGNGQLANRGAAAIHYDVANANPYGRVVVLAIRVAW